MSEEKDVPDRFILEHLDQIDIVAPDGTLTRADKVVGQEKEKAAADRRSVWPKRR
jgi:hypothetical protein